MHKIVFNVFASYKVERLKCRGAAADSHAQSAALPRFGKRIGKGEPKARFEQPDRKWGENGDVFGLIVPYLLKCRVYVKIWIPPRGDFGPTNGF